MRKFNARIFENEQILFYIIANLIIVIFIIEIGYTRFF
jgi:hypothetical protein